ncbi:hypothetical protein NQ315_005381 [Exocentrus adspersus]|uniref:Probable proline--tRNA ligase, mitochondrial n=1 Tax=Exocentrus adspersus TaxID=1586481 RepID=A0AAV8W2Y4_9CUCU|nr:hypothetical protein NQ315_005381 [Exocentrus adspersus]
MSVSSIHYLSKIFQPVTVISKTASISRKDVTSKSQRLMLELGIIRQSSPGFFHFLPLGIKSLNKLKKIVNQEMNNVGGQNVLCPSLINCNLWKTSGRLENAGPELFQLKDRHRHSYVLSPTHEEAISDLISSVSPLSYKQFPLRLYQISSKYRDEIKPRFGLMRGREFVMKDMYTFDTDIESAKQTYDLLCESYNNIFKKVGVDFIKVLGTTGNIGGSVSHEFHFKAEIGEDKVLFCHNCNYSGNLDLCNNEKCPVCGEEKQIDISNCIEVGHTFLLGDKYSKPLKATFLSKDNKPVALQMGCFGLGLSRILAASVEVLSLEQEIRWPDVLAPYNVVIIPPKMGSKEEQDTKHVAEILYTRLESAIPHLTDNVLVDDRLSLTIGRRHLDARRVGYRYVIVINKKASESVPLFELNDIKTNGQLYLSENELISFIKDNTVL